MREFQRWVAAQRLCPKRHLSRKEMVTSLCMHALRHLRDRSFLESGSMLGAVSLRKVVTTDASLTGWGGVQGQDSQGEMACLATESTHKLPGTVNSVSGIKTFCTVPKEPPRFDQLRQQNGGGIHKLTRGHTFPSASQSGTEIDRVGHKTFPVTTGNTCPGNNECGGGSPIQGKSPVRRMDSPPSGSEPAVGEVRPSGRRSLCLARKHALPTILLAGGRRCAYVCGCASTPVAKRTALRISSTESDRTYTKKSKGTQSY